MDFGVSSGVFLWHPECFSTFRYSTYLLLSVSDDKPEKVAPALPSKKPMLPPPVSKKPHPPRPSDHKPVAPSDDHKVKESQKDAPEKPQDANGFDSIESTEKLTHLTAHRAKRPNKRPPSQILLHKDNSVSLFPPFPSDIAWCTLPDSGILPLSVLLRINCTNASTSTQFFVVLITHSCQLHLKKEPIILEISS